MQFLNNTEINYVYNSLKHNSIIKITLDLSRGLMSPNMQQTLNIQVNNSNKKLIRKLLSDHPIIEAVILDDSY